MIGFERHDHSRCIDAALSLAETRCAQARVQFTDTRRRVLEILLQEHRALGAYDILGRLGGEGRPAQPPVAYRALDFLVSHGLAHKVERLSAYVACAHPTADHMPAFLICRACDTVAEAELDSVRDGLARVAHKAGFRIEGSVVEALGLCPSCRVVAA